MNDEWADALNEQYGEGTIDTDDTDTRDEEADTSTDETVENEQTRDEENQDETEEQPDEAPEDESDEGSEDDESGDEGDESEGDPLPEDETDSQEPQEAPAPSQKDLIKEALKELNQERETYTSEVTSMKEEVLETLYPEGIQRQLLDSGGDPIRNIDDVMKLENPRTGELFTEDEAGAWLLSAQQELNKNIEEMESYAETVAEANLQLRDGVERVKEVHGELLGSLPQDAVQQLRDAYDQTLVKDPKTGTILKAPVDIVNFFTVALSGYSQAKQAQAEAQAAAAKKQAQANKANQRERGDLPPSGEPTPRLRGEDKAWADAYESYFNE